MIGIFIINMNRKPRVGAGFKPALLIVPKTVTKTDNKNRQ